MDVGTDINVNDKELLHEYNPDLRVDDNKNAVQFALDMASFKAGLGTKYYQFNTANATIVTATQYVGDRQDLVINAKKYRDRLNKFISDIIRASLLLDKIIFHENVVEDCDVLVENVDGFMVDQETVRNEARQDLASGVISKVEYRMKVFHEDENTAKTKVQEINNQYNVNNIEGE